MDVHLVSIEVSVVGRANALIESQSIPRLHFDLVGHHGHPMQGRLTVENHYIFVLNVSEDDISILEVICQVS